MPEMKSKTYVEFTKKMKDDGYTILIPTMLPMHFRLLLNVFESFGYNIKLLETTGPQIADTGLRYTHNDTCYPAILVIGQFIDAIKNGGYDPDRVALMMFQTGGGCRASNYISLIRKALAKAGYSQIPVISFSLANIEKHSGFHLTPAMLLRMAYALLCGDLLMTLRNQCRSAELTRGSTDELCSRWTAVLEKEMAKGSKTSYRKVKEYYREIINDFSALPRSREKRVKVGIVGEIYVKYSPLANNSLEDFLVSEGTEVVVPGLLDFFMYCVYNNIRDAELYGRGRLKRPVTELAFRILRKKQLDMINAIREYSDFTPPTPFIHTSTLADGYINTGAKMGEGWLLTAEMLELAESGVKNIVCAQPFGCLPNHIVGKGMMRPIKEKNPDVNIVAIDYDAGATRINQENRLKLMLANARAQMENEKQPSGEKRKAAEELSPVH